MGPLLRCLALIPLLLVVCSSSAMGASYAPPPGKVLQGGTGGYTAAAIASWAQLAGRPPSVYQFFFTPGWRQPSPGSLRWQRGLLTLTEAAGALPMFHLSTSSDGHGGSTITPGAIAQGQGDPYLLALNAMVYDSGQTLYLRVMAEMNNWNNPYSAFGATGRRRGPKHSAASYQQAFRRIALVVRGGSVPRINARLARLGLPPLATTVGSLPQPRIALLWVPLCAGLPAVPGNDPGSYWPGSAYVDWVGNDFFANSPNFPCIQRFYCDPRWDDKPYAFGEWALWGRDDPGFVRRLFGWVRTHPRVQMVVYNQGANYTPLLALRPAAAAELQRQLQSPRFAIPPVTASQRPPPSSCSDS